MDIYIRMSRSKEKMRLTSFFIWIKNLMFIIFLVEFGQKNKLILYVLA